MGGATAKDIQAFLTKLGARYPHPGTLYLLGGSALCLLGSPRQTLDIDYDAHLSTSDPALRTAMQDIAKMMGLEIEEIRFDEFIPVPEDASRRHRHIGQFGQLQVYVFDPYSIALSKLDRGFETDLQDVLFLLRRRVIALKELEHQVKAALPRAQAFDIDKREFQKNWATLRKMINR